MHESSTDGDDGPHTDPAEPKAPDVATDGLSAADYVRLAEECMTLASLTKDPDKAAELIKTGDDYLRRAAKWLADQLKDP
jgi:hypothetical protein